MDMDGDIWILTCSMLVFFMQAGFAMLEVGTIRAKNAQHILVKNVFDLCIAGIIWYLLGYGLAFGNDAYQFIGTSEFANPNSTVNWMFQYAFSTTSATIVSGSMAERTELIAYVIFTTFLTAIIYPIFAHWVWGNGWLQNIGYYDFAGSSVVHMTGGIAGIIGAIMLGPRKGRFQTPDNFKPHNVPLIILGMLILWLGWYGFNGGSIRNFSSEHQYIGNIMIMTSLSGSTAGLVSTFIDCFKKKRKNNLRFEITHLTNGILGGMVAITGCPPTLNAAISIFIGAIAGILTRLTSNLVKRIKIDDPLDAFAVHAVAGFWGTLAVGLFSPTSGVFYGYDFKQFGIQFLGAIVNMIWVGLLSLSVFFFIKKAGWLRIDEDIQIVGIDICEHGGSAYRGSPILDSEFTNSVKNNELKTIIPIIEDESSSDSDIVTEDKEI